MLTAAPDPRELAPHFPQLEIVELVGRGGAGAVYKARQKSLGRWVALKVLSQEYAGEAEFAARFDREAHALASLAHQNIVTVHDAGRAGPYLYLLMEFVDGVNLRTLMRAGRLAPQQALAITSEICAGLAFAHDSGVVHRDIKPENVLLDSKGRAKIADFGLAKLVSKDALTPTLTQSHQVMGSPQYMAPEQIEHPATVDHRADLFALGVVLYELLTGELPLGHFEVPSQRASVDVRLDEIVLHALQKDRERRYQRASDIKTDVDLVVSTPRHNAAPGTERREMPETHAAPAPRASPKREIRIPAAKPPPEAVLSRKAPAPAARAPAKKHSVRILSVGPSPKDLQLVLQALTGCDAKTAEAMLKNVPIDVAKDVEWARAQMFRARLEAFGAETEVL